MNVTLDMAEFTAHTPDIICKELAAGLITANLICTVLVQSACWSAVAPNRLLFQASLRRIRDAMLVGVHAWVVQTGAVTTSMSQSIRRCRNTSPTIVKHSEDQNIAIL